MCAMTTKTVKKEKCTNWTWINHNCWWHYGQMNGQIDEWRIYVCMRIDFHDRDVWCVYGVCVYLAWFNAWMTELFLFRFYLFVFVCDFDWFFFSHAFNDNRNQSVNAVVRRWHAIIPMSNTKSSAIKFTMCYPQSELDFILSLMLVCCSLSRFCSWKLISCGLHYPPGSKTQSISLFKWMRLDALSISFLANYFVDATRCRMYEAVWKSS